MIIVGIVLAALAVLAVALCAVADPVLLSRLNGEPTESARGRHIQVRPESVPRLTVIRNERFAA